MFVLQFATAHADSINLIQNGSFENDPLPGLGRLSTTALPTGWTVNTGYGVLINNTSTGSYLPPASDGNQYYYIGDYGQHADIAQTVQLQAGHTYLLNFDLSPLLRTPDLDSFFAYSPANVDLTITGENQTFLPGLTYDYIVPPQAQRWLTETYKFTVGYTGNYTFDFTTQGQNGGYTDAAFLDNVVLQDTTPARRVPEGGATLGLLATGLLGLATFRRPVSRR